MYRWLHIVDKITDVNKKIKYLNGITFLLSDSCAQSPDDLVTFKT